MRIDQTKKEYEENKERPHISYVLGALIIGTL